MPRGTGKTIDDQKEETLTDILAMSDDLGPEQVLHLSNPAAGLQAILVVDNTATGPSIGGVRMAPDVSLEECARLARAMTLKNAAAGLSHGGGKAVIFADPAMPEDQKEQLMRAFADAIRDVQSYIPGPDMGTNETCMAWVREEIGRAVGLPGVIGGIPLDEIGATGLGVATACEVAQSFCDLKLQGARVAIQGFGAVGKHTALCLAERGAKLVAVSDSRGSIMHPDGLDLSALLDLKERGKSVAELKGAESQDREAVITADCDILVPAARPDVISAENADDINARLVVEGANIPATEEAEEILQRRGILVVPDFIANAGGVITAAFEYQGSTESQALSAVVEKVRKNTQEVLEGARQSAEMPRIVARKIAEARVRKAMSLRRFR